MTKICPDCGKEQEDINKFCKNCGCNLLNVASVDGSNGSDNVSASFGGAGAVDDGIKRCSVCGTELIRNEKFCPHCGQRTGLGGVHASSEGSFAGGFDSSEGSSAGGFDSSEANTNSDGSSAGQSGYSRGTFSDSQTNQRKPAKKKHPILSLVLSFFYPGLGQIYNGETLKGICFIFAAIILACSAFIIGALGYILFWIFWVYALYNAYTVAKRINEGTYIIEK
ncbi:zinc-ribbon domain-containing protein [uncultured Methanobrevibacter sp.]|uniref:zinc-ribbon domain-containing protein n=1 Tax=uncultured Methanobrevibacter sp. TaxID=253161 RepID=UPI00262FAFB5